jgi:hypothetical protein
VITACFENLAAVVTLTVLVVIVVRASGITGIITTRSKNRNASKSHYQRKKQTNQFLFHVFSPLLICAAFIPEAAERSAK